MAIIDKHKHVKIDKEFSDKHVALFAYLDKQGIDVEVSDNFEEFNAFIGQLPKSDYPYNPDEFFGGSMLPDILDKTFALYLKKGDTIIGTYAARELRFNEFYIEFTNWAEDGYYKLEENGKELSESIMYKPGRHMYSSCQWVHKDYRGKKLGMALDNLKKNICFDVFEADTNYCFHKPQFADYHIKGLHYDESMWMLTVPKGDISDGIGKEKDKSYNVAFVSKESWKNKLDDVRKLYV